MTRSDDYLRGIPRWISYERGGTPDSILDYSRSSQFISDQDTPLTYFLDEILLFPDEMLQRVLGTLLPLEMAYSFREWSVFLRAFLVIPLFFVVFGYRLRIGVLASLTVALTPLSLWFGSSALAMTAAVLLPLALTRLFLATYYSQLHLKLLLLILLGLYCGKSAFGAIDYPPWKWPLLIVFGIYALVHMLTEFGFRKILKPMAVVIFFVGALQAFRWGAYKNQYSATLDTVYPGKRRAEGGGGYGNPMAGAITWFMQTDEAAESGTVNPEFAFSLNALLWPCILGGQMLLQSRQRSPKSKAYLSALVPMGLIVLWVSTKWPAVLLSGNPLQFISTDRAGQILGVIGILLFFLLVDLRQPTRGWTSVLSGLLSGLIVFTMSVGDSVYWNNYFYNSKPYGIVWISVAILSICVFMFYVVKTPVLAVLPVLLFSIASSYKIQPITVGLGPLVDSPVALAVRDIVKNDPDALWGSDPYWGDALTIAQGARMISGQQPLGPNKDLWRMLDPEGRSVNYWNRGQSYIHFIWDQNEPGVRILNPSPDVISVVTAPCGSVMKSFGLRYVMTKESPGTCARQLFTGQWMATPVAIYKLDS